MPQPSTPQQPQQPQVPQTPATPQQPQQPQQPQTPGGEGTTENQNTGLLGGLVSLQQTETKTTEDYLREQAAGADAGKIPFSLGLDNLALNNGMMGGGSGGANVTDVALSGTVSGYWITDPNLKQVAMVMTVFQSFPVMINGIDKPYSMVVDQTSTVDGAGTNKGELCIGVLGCPDGYRDDYLTKVASNTKGGGFKVGASFWNERGLEYMTHYYPEAGITLNQLNTLRRKCLLNAEVVIPTGATTGKAFKIKMVDEGPRPPYAYVKSGANAGLWKLDIIGAFCMLTENQGLFDIKGKYNGKYEKIDNTQFQFPFKDSTYDILTGEIQGYTPEAMKELVAKGVVNENKALVTKYLGSPIGNDTVCRVRFYIEAAHRAEAEQVCGKALPDDLFKTNGTYGVGGMIGNFNALPPDAGVAERIMYCGQMVSSIAVAKGWKWSYCGGYAPTADGLIMTKTGIDCASGVNAILASAGLIDILRAQKDGIATNTTWYRGKFLEYVMPGYTVTKVQPEAAAPGDVVFWDRMKSSNNHAAIYMGPSSKFDFGGNDSVRTQQPLNKPLKLRPFDNVKQVTIYRFSPVAAAGAAAPAATPTV